MGGALLEPVGVRLKRDNSTNLTNPWTSPTKQKAAQPSHLGKSMPFRPAALAHRLFSTCVYGNHGFKGGNKTLWPVLTDAVFYILFWCFMIIKGKNIQLSVLSVPLVNIVPPNFWHIQKSFLANVVISNLVWLRMYSVILLVEAAAKKT